MMKVLIVRLSSMGDIVHTMPALSDAQAAYPAIEFHWVVDENFSALPKWHPAVSRVINCSHRQWKKQWFKSLQPKAFPAFYRQLRSVEYDIILDTQASIKSALITRLAKGKWRVGHDKHTVREYGAHLLYNQCYHVDRQQHAIERARQLFSYALDYPTPDAHCNYGFKASDFTHSLSLSTPYVVLVHATTWASKHWPRAHWSLLGQLLNAQGYHVVLPWYSAQEKQSANTIASKIDRVTVLPDGMALNELMGILAGAHGWVGVDTGLSHLAAALDVPGFSLFGPTNPDLTQPIGKEHNALFSTLSCAPCLKKQCHYQNQKHAQAVCLMEITPDSVSEKLLQKFNRYSN